MIDNKGKVYNKTKKKFIRFYFPEITNFRKFSVSVSGLMLPKYEF